MARIRYQPGIYQLNNIDTATTLEAVVDTKTIFVPPSSSVTVVVRNYLSKISTIVKLEVSYIGQIEGDNLGISGNIVSNT